MAFDSEFSVFKDNNSIQRLGIRWGGIAGDGVQAMGVLFSKYLNKLGYFSFGFPGTQSTIRGGHIWYHTEFSVTDFDFYDRSCDILIAFNSQTLDIHLPDLKRKAILLINSDTDKINKGAMKVIVLTGNFIETNGE